MMACTMFPFSIRKPDWTTANTRDCHSYRILSFSVHLSSPNTWHTAFTLARISDQPSLLHALQIPTSDQLDDWKDYQRLKLIDRGDDFAMLREILAQPQGVGEGDAINDGRHGSEDSGYFSRRSSKAVSIGGGGRGSILVEELGELVERVDREDDKHEDDEAEEADDEGAGLEDLEEDEDEDDGDGKEETINTKTNSDHAMDKDGIAQPTALNQTVTPKHVHQALPQTRFGTRFISPRRPAEPRLSSADEAMVAGARYPVVGK